MNSLRRRTGVLRVFAVQIYDSRRDSWRVYQLTSGQPAMFRDSREAKVLCDTLKFNGIQAEVDPMEVPL